MRKDDKFHACLKYIKESEGGDTNHKNDRGGATRQGVSQKAYDLQQRELGNKGVIKSVFELKNEEIEEFYYYFYKKYNIEKIEDINSRYLYFDAVILQGPLKAAKMAQSVCNLKADGCFGKNSIACVNSMNQKDFQNKFTQLRRDHFIKIVKNNSIQEVFLKGWINRVDRTLSQVQNGTIQKQCNTIQNQRHQQQDKFNQQTQNPKGIDSSIKQDQNQCSIQNDNTCYYCFELITSQDPNPKIYPIDNYIYIFHQSCYHEYETIINSEQNDEDWYWD